MQKPFDREGFPARIGPIPFLGIALFSQTGMSFVQQGLVILGTFFLTVYHLNLTELGFVTTALSLGVMTSMIFVGAMVDRLGPRVVLFWGAALMAGFTLLLLTVKSFLALLAVLFMVGIVLAVVPLSGTKAVFTAFANRPRGLVMGIRQTGVPVGAAMAAWLLPILVSRWSLHWVYGLFSIELLVTGWLFSSVIQPWHLTPIFAEHSQLTRNEWKLLLKPVLVAFLMVSGQYILLTYSITDLYRVHHLSLGLAGVVLAASQMGGGIGRVLLGQMSDWIGGRRSPVIAFAAVFGAIFAIITGALPGDAPFGLLLTVWSIFGFSAVGWNALVLTWAGESVPSSHSGLAMGVTGSTVFLGSSVFPPLFGFAVDVSHHMATGWWLLAGILLIAGLLSWQSSLPKRQELVDSSPAQSR